MLVSYLETELRKLQKELGFKDIFLSVECNDSGTDITEENVDIVLTYSGEILNTDLGLTLLKRHELLIRFSNTVVSLSKPKEEILKKLTEIIKDYMKE